MSKRKPFTELHVDGRFTEDRAECKEELQSHCEEVYDDEEETDKEAEGEDLAVQDTG